MADDFKHRLFSRLEAADLRTPQSFPPTRDCGGTPPFLSGRKTQSGLDSRTVFHFLTAHK